MRKEVQKIICYVILLGMTFCLSACTEAIGTPAKTEEAGTENIEVTEQVQEKQLYEYAEEDFLALSESYKEKGETDKQRETLIEMHKWFPSKENAGRISEVIVERDTSDTTVMTLLDAVYTALENATVEEVKALLSSEEWQQQMQDELVGVTRKTKYTGELYVAQISSDPYATEIMLIKKDNTLLYYKQNQTGTVWGSIGCKDGAYDGAYELTYLNAEGEEVKKCEGTFASNISTGKFTVIYKGTSYAGELSDKGTTLAEQKKKLTDAGSVIYAYDASKTKYLYEENCTVETFVIDAQYLGLPAYEEW